jgi:hypothetical protein
VKCEAVYPFEQEEKRCQLDEGHTENAHEWSGKDKRGHWVRLVWSDR